MLPSAAETLPTPDPIDETAALELLARGWLDSAIRDGERVRHAVPFAWERPSDAPVLMRYLASELNRRAADRELASRLGKTAADLLAKIPAPEVGRRTVSHIKLPAPALVAGDPLAELAFRRSRTRELNLTLADGRRRWQPQPGRPDFGETLAIVDKVTGLYHGTVPRGAQPWEMPLHTPDIMASAHLTRIYALANLLRPSPAYVSEARHWAYTGLSMVYLVPPPFDFVRLADGSLLHFPGAADEAATDSTLCHVEGWPETAFHAVVTRVRAPMTATLNGETVETRYDAGFHALILTLPAGASGTLRLIPLT